RSTGDYSLELRALYHQIAFDLRHPRAPILSNTDGDPLALTTLEFELRCSVQNAVDALRPLTLTPAEDVQDGETLNAETRHGVVQRMRRENGRHKSWDNRVRGNLTPSEAKWTAEVNSKGGADRLRKEVAKLLGERVVFAGSRVADIDLLRKHHASDRATAS